MILGFIICLTLSFILYILYNYLEKHYKEYVPNRINIYEGTIVKKEHYLDKIVLFHVKININ